MFYKSYYTLSKILNKTYSWNYISSAYFVNLRVGNINVYIEK